jgi:hypothetical protein
MNTNTKNVYIDVKDERGFDYVCPLEAVVDRDSVSDQEIYDCVEKDVVEQYAGNIDIIGPVQSAA